MNPAIQGLITIIIGVGGCVGYFYGANLLLDKVLFPARDIEGEEANTHRRFVAAVFGAIPAGLLLLFFVLPQVIRIARTYWVRLTTSGDDVQDGLTNAIAQAEGAVRFEVLLRDLGYTTIVFLLIAIMVYVLLGSKDQLAGRNINRANQIRPWLFLLPALLALGLYLAYPVFATLRLSFLERLPGNEYAFVGFENYTKMFAEPKFMEALRNNVLWLIVVPAAATGFGLLAAQLTDRLIWGNIAKSIVFMPMAISFVGAAVIFKLIYEARPEDVAQIGILNYLYLLFGGSEPQQWLQIPFWNNFFLMAVLVWIQTGFAMVILSAALRGIPEETVEAAIIDGANPFQIFFKIKIPQIMSTIVVVWTTITIATLKVFDIVFAMTNGQWETQVLANYMYDKLFRANDWGMGSASAMIIMLMVTPILVWNVYNARKEMQ